MTRPAISLADLLTAADRLHPGPEALRMMARALGLVQEVSAVSAPADPPMPPSGPSGPSGWQPHSPPPAAEDGGDIAVSTPSAADPRPVRRPRLLTVERVELAPPRPDTLDVEDALVATSAPKLVRLGSLEQPLFAPAQHRTVLTALASTERPGREVDLPAAVAMIATRRPLDRIPRRPYRSTALGLQLLVDTATSMRPFLRDVRLLAQSLEHVVGIGNVEQIPLVTGEHGFESALWSDDDPPTDLITVPGRPVLVTTDLGAARCPDPREDLRRFWLALVEQARSRRCPVIFLVPFPPTRWPLWAVQNRLTIVQWDRATETQIARRAAERALAATTGPPP
jgi:hypothetical protein